MQGLALTWVDALIGIVVLAAAVYGYAKGFRRVVSGLVGYGVAALVGGRFAGALLGWLDARGTAVEALRERLIGYEVLPASARVTVGSASASQVQQVAGQLGVPSPYGEELAAQVMILGRTEPDRTLGELLTRLVTQDILEFAMFLLIGAAVVYLLRTVVYNFTTLMDRPHFITPAARGGGLALGVVAAVLGLALLLWQAGPVYALSFMGPTGRQVGQSTLAGWLRPVHETMAPVVFGSAEPGSGGK